MCGNRHCVSTDYILVSLYSLYGLVSTGWRHFWQLEELRYFCKVCGDLWRQTVQLNVVARDRTCHCETAFVTPNLRLKICDPPFDRCESKWTSSIESQFDSKILKAVQLCMVYALCNTLFFIVFTAYSPTVVRVPFKTISNDEFNQLVKRSLFFKGSLKALDMPDTAKPNEPIIFISFSFSRWSADQTCSRCPVVV